MIVWFTFGAALFAVLASAQIDGVPARSGAGVFVLPRPGVPVSLDQIEERSRKLEDGTSKVEVIKSRIYRDSAGRLLIESGIPNDTVQSSFSYIDLIDPIAGSRFLLLSTHGVAYRMSFAKSAASKFAFLGIGGGVAPSDNWSIRTEHAGKRMIAGIGFEGTRIIRTSESEPQLTQVVEHWYSDELKLMGSVVTSGPYEAGTVRIQNLRREEPDPALFTIPSGYKIIDMQSPSPDPQ
jgi:hypothetical protein